MALEKLSRLADALPLLEARRYPSTWDASLSLTIDTVVTATTTTTTTTGTRRTETAPIATTRRAAGPHRESPPTRLRWTNGRPLTISPSLFAGCRAAQRRPFVDWDEDSEIDDSRGHSVMLDAHGNAVEVDDAGNPLSRDGYRLDDYGRRIDSSDEDSSDWSEEDGKPRPEGLESPGSDGFGSTGGTSFGITSEGQVDATEFEDEASGDQITLDSFSSTL